MKYFVINYADGEYRHGEWENYYDCLDYAETNSNGYDFFIEEFDSEEDYLNSL